ncbi:hypothetical protein BGZ98_000161 [Dissophora globulifera]|nr:hypothetical protein BGZ98_000161 [Dissophora globulifera]
MWTADAAVVALHNNKHEILPRDMASIGMAQVQAQIIALHQRSDVAAEHKPIVKAACHCDGDKHDGDDEDNDDSEEDGDDDGDNGRGHSEHSHHGGRHGHSGSTTPSDVSYPTATWAATGMGASPTMTSLPSSAVAFKTPVGALGLVSIILGVYFI